MNNVDIARRWVRVIGKGDKERRVPIDADVAGVIQTDLLVERPETDTTTLFVVGARVRAVGGRSPQPGCARCSAMSPWARPRKAWRGSQCGRNRWARRPWINLG
jgi:site-specific recombinase XerC